MNTGALVIYRGRSAVITGIGRDKIEIRGEGGTERSVRPKDIEFLHPGPVAVLPPPEVPEPDWPAVVELMDDETLSFGEWVELAYGRGGAPEYYAAWRVLTGGDWFSGSIDSGVTPLPPELLAERRAAREAREAERAAREALLDRIRRRAVIPEDRRALREIEAVALGSAGSSRLLKELGIEAAPEKAHRLLLELGVWDCFVDPWPARLGVETQAPELPLPELPDEARVDLTGMRSLAIDDSGSDDPDDAVAFADGCLYVHVADPAAVIHPGDPVDREARLRGATCYLPERVVPMLPEAATAQFGLGLKPVSPALTFVIRITADGEAVLERMMPSLVAVTRLTYESAAGEWEQSPLREIRSELERFRERRRREGALFIRLPEVKTVVRGREIVITPCPVTPERELVANAMLAAGHAAAKFMAEQGAAFPFVTQAPPETPERGETLAAMYELRRNSAPSVPGPVPGRHFGLGLEPYARITSPLRRYADLWAHYQLRRIMRGEEPLTWEELESALTYSEAGAAVRRKLERYADEYWLLVYLKLHPDWEGFGVAVDRQGERLTLAIPEFAYEYKSRYQGKIGLDDEVGLKLADSDPAALRAAFQIKR